MAGSIVPLNVALELASTMLADITVTGERGGLRTPDQKRRLVTVSDVVSAHEIGLLPNQNVAEAVQPVPGVYMEKNDARRRPYRVYSWRGAESEQRDAERSADGIDGHRPRLRARPVAGLHGREQRSREGGDTEHGCEYDFGEPSTFAH